VKKTTLALKTNKNLNLQRLIRLWTLWRRLNQSICPNNLPSPQEGRRQLQRHLTHSMLFSHLLERRAETLSLKSVIWSNIQDLHLSSRIHNRKTNLMKWLTKSVLKQGIPKACQREVKPVQKIQREKLAYIVRHSIRIKVPNKASTPSLLAILLSLGSQRQ